jgi:hypothetical protein
MNDWLLATVVIAAVIAFGALISVGNERQRRAIVGLHQAYKQWAVHDLRLKRGTVSVRTQIEDLTVWLTKATSLAFGRKTIVMDYQLHESPVPTVEFHDAEVGTTVICTIESPAVLLPMLKQKRSALRGELRSNPAFQITRKTPAIELSMLNAGALFDIELPVAWNTLTGQVTDSDTLWAYILNG